MTVVFIGGPLDGELREVRDGAVIVYVPPSDREWEGKPLGPSPPAHRYHISNGIARHESLSEEEVARRVASWHDLVSAPGLPLHHQVLGEGNAP